MSTKELMSQAAADVAGTVVNKISLFAWSS